MAPILIALAIIVLTGSWLLNKASRGSRKVTPPQILVIALLVTLLGLLGNNYLKPPESVPSLEGMLAGATLVLFAGYSQRINQAGAVALSVACLASAILNLLPAPHLDSSCLGMLVGSGIAAASLRLKTSSFAALTLSAVALVQLLGRSKTGISPSDYSGGLAIGSLTVVAFLGMVARKLREKAWLWSLICGGTGAVALLAVGKFCYPESSDWFGLLTAPVAALVIFWLQKNNSDRPKFGLVLSTMIWIGLATVAFGVQRGVGIGMAFMIGTGVLVLLEADDVLLSSGPLLALALHRAFRLEHSGVGAAIDIGQHYALIGFSLAALLPLLPIEWQKLQGRLRPSMQSMGAGIWLFICFASPVLIALFLAPKGLLGFVTGLGFCGFFGLLDPDPDLSVLCLAAGIGGAAILEYGPVEKLTNLDRVDKIHWFLVTAMGLACLAGVLTAISTFNLPKEQVSV